MRHVLDKFGVRYSANGALRLTSRLNFSVRKPRPVPYNSATKEEIEKYVNDTIKEIEAHAKRGYKVVCLDAAALIDSPLSRRGIRRRGGRDTVKINYSRQSIKLIGALGRDSLDIQFHENLATGNVIELLEELRQKYVNVFVIMDNASAHKSREMEDYAMGTNGSVVRWFLPPYTPQQNPIEIQWREIKRAIADTFFVDLTSCRRESGRCWMPGRCPEQDCLDTCWMPWNAKRIQKRRAPRRSATLTACQNVPRHSMRDANHVRIKSMNSRECAGSLHDMPEKPKSGCNMTPNDHQSCLV